MEFLKLLVGFGLGLSLGLAILYCYYLRSQRELLYLLRRLGIDAQSSALPLISQLSSSLLRQKQRCDQIEDHLRRWQTILRAAPLCYVQVDEENQIVWCNDVARQILGIQQWPVSQPRLLLEVVRSYEMDQLIEQTRETQKSCQSEWLFPPNADHLPSKESGLWVRGYGIPLLDGHVGIFLENRQEMAILKQQRDRWTSDVAHELKTPLTSIRLVAETLQMRLEPPLKAWVDRLVGEVIRLSTLVQDLLDINQLQNSPTAHLVIKAFNLVELIQSAWINLEPLARKKQLQLDYAGPENLTIYGDEHRLYRVLINLLDNSIKYSPPRQRILVQLSCESSPNPVEPTRKKLLTKKRLLEVGISNAQAHHHHHQPLAASEQRVRLEVIDAGPGFPESSLAHVFDRFYRVSPSRSRQLSSSHFPQVEGEADSSDTSTSADNYYGGSGLGLAIVRQIVEAHQGQITASNHPETGGAWLQVWLPLEPQSESLLLAP